MIDKVSSTMEAEMNKNTWECYEGFLADPGIDRMQKVLARYEMYKMIQDLPGEIIEVGVHNGSSFFTWLKFLQIFEPHSARIVRGFDTFEGFPDTSLEVEEIGPARRFEETAITNQFEHVRLTSEKIAPERWRLHCGNIMYTGPEFAKEAGGVRIALLHIDVDTYHGTLAAMRCFYPLMTYGGIVLLDEYGIEKWGESNGFDEYFHEVGMEPPTTFCVKHSGKPTAYHIVAGKGIKQ